MPRKWRAPACLESGASIWCGITKHVVCKHNNQSVHNNTTGTDVLCDTFATHHRNILLCILQYTCTHTLIHCFTTTASSHAPLQQQQQQAQLLATSAAGRRREQVQTQQLKQPDKRTADMWQYTHQYRLQVDRVHCRY